MTEPDRPLPDGVGLEHLYDAETLSLIEAQTVLPAAAPDAAEDDVDHDPVGEAPDDEPATGPPVRFRGVRGAVLAGAMLGVAEVFEPEPDKQSVVEFAPAPADHHDDPIEFVFVNGSPRRSRIIYRPWLCAPPRP